MPPNAHLFLQALVLVAFAAALVRILRHGEIRALAVLFATLFSVVAGEGINLLVSRATAYAGTDGIPPYIVLGGSLVGLGLYRAAGAMARRFARDTAPCRLGCALLLTGLFPLMELAGIALGWWRWLHPVNYAAPGWLFGVWLFYLLFVGSPALVALLLPPPESTLLD